MAAGREHGKLARAAPLQHGDFQDAPGTQVPTGIERAASKLARVAPLQDGDFQDVPGTQDRAAPGRLPPDWRERRPCKMATSRMLQERRPERQRAGCLQIGESGGRSGWPKFGEHSVLFGRSVLFCVSPGLAQKNWSMRDR